MKSAGSTLATDVSKGRLGLSPAKKAVARADLNIVSLLKSLSNPILHSQSQPLLSVLTSISSTLKHTLSPKSLQKFNYLGAANTALSGLARWKAPHHRWVRRYLWHQRQSSNPLTLLSPPRRLVGASPKQTQNLDLPLSDARSTAYAATSATRANEPGNSRSAAAKPASVKAAISGSAATTACKTTRLARVLSWSMPEARRRQMAVKASTRVLTM